MCEESAIGGLVQSMGGGSRAAAISEMIRPAPTAAIVPAPRVEMSFRVGTMADLPFLDRMQKQFGKELGYFPTKQFEGYINMGGVLVAEANGAPVGYCISRDRYLKRDELGIIYQLCVAPGYQRGLIGAALVLSLIHI